MNQKTQQIERAIDRDVAGNIEVAGFGGMTTMAPRNMGELMEFAKMMATGGIALREEFRNNPGTCLAVSLQALRWGMDPYAVASKAYAVNNQLAYESQLIHAVVNTLAPLQERLRPKYEGEGQKRKCTINGLLRGEDEPLVYDSPEIGNISPKNSPLWKSDPDQQLFYYSVRAWARRHVPEVLMGVYDPDEAAAMHRGPEHARLVGGDRPQRQEYVAGPGDIEEHPMPETWPRTSQFGEDMEECPADEWWEWWWDCIGGMIAEDHIADHIRNNYEVAATIAANDIDSITLRGLQVRMANEGWPPEKWQPTIAADNMEPEEAAEPTPEAAQSAVQAEMDVGGAGPKELLEAAIQGFKAAETASEVAAAGGEYHPKLLAANAPSEIMDEFNGAWSFRLEMVGG